MARARHSGEDGFTLVEALVALGLVASVVIGYIGIRTTALIDATYARNWRLAREIAEQKMSELQAGARETPPQSGDEVDLEDFKGFSYKIVLGESAVANAEAEIGNAAAGDDTAATERIDWQQKRDNYRRASSRGQSAIEYEEQQAEDVNKRLAEKAPSATEFEQVAVVVMFPKLDADYPDQKDSLLIKARVSTLAISGMTPEQAAAMAQSMGQAGGEGGANAAGGGGGGSGPGSVGGGNQGGR